MLISTNWIKDFVELPQDFSAQQIAERFTLATAEVEEVVEVGQHLEKIVVAEIKSIRKHPEADKLNLVTFNFGKGEKEVVCGAPNVREGLKVPYAPLGTTLPGGFKLEAKKIRGILSEGMLCSEKELQLGEGAAGLMELDGSAPNGQKMKEYLKAESDVLLDIDNKSLTHRPDLWGHFGMAREMAAAFLKPLKKPYDQKWQEKLEKHFNDEKSPIAPVVQKESSCLGYFALSLDNISVTSSPQWMQQRLLAVGLRPINSIVDISNYVMLELGIPLHIFDRDKIAGDKLFIKKIGSETKFTTLDEIERDLLASDTVIADSEKPLVLAGIMGGANSGVSDGTSKILIEVANWKAEEVRRTSTRLGLRTDSSQRYEKSLDTHLCYRTLLRTLELILEFCPEAKIIGRPHYDGVDLSQASVLSLSTSVSNINKVLGKNIDEEKIVDIFKRLDFSVQAKGESLLVTIPTFRTTKDIECEADLIEEVGRMIGYDSIEPQPPKVSIHAVRLTQEKELHRKIQDYLSLSARSLEVFTYPLVGKKLLEKAHWHQLNEELVLVNALSHDHDRMRPSIIPSLLEAAALNAKNFSDFSFFEIGRSYLPSKKDFNEERAQIVVTEFSRSKNTFINLINKVEGLLDSLNIPYSLERETGKFDNPLVAKDWIGLHPHEQLHVRIMGRFMGLLNTAHPLLLRQYKLKGHLSFAVIDVTEFAQKPPKNKIKYQPLLKYPASTFDCSVLVKSDVLAQDVLRPLQKLKIKQLVSQKIVTVFPLEDGYKSVTVRVVFEDPKETLSSEFLKSAEQQVVQTLQDAGFPLKS